MRNSAACVVLVALLSPLWAPGAAAVDHVHSSSRYDRSPASLHAQAERWDASSADLVTWTEVDGARARALHRVSGWAAYTPDPTDVAISWRRDRYRALHTGQRRLTEHTYRTYTTGRTVTQWAAAAVLVDRRTHRRVLIVAVHLPAHVQAGPEFRANTRARVWRTGLEGLHAYAAQLRTRWHPDLVLVAGDWNVDLRRPTWRHQLHAVFPGLRNTRVRPFPADGTDRTRRLIDATLTNGTGRARLLPDDRSSDHRPYGETITATHTF